MNKIVIIDGYSLLFRAYFATFSLDRTKIMKNHDGIPTNAIYGFFNMLIPILKNLKENDALFVALDSSKKTFRHLEYKEYKANRKPLDEELKIQFPIFRELLQSLNITFYENENLEADDIAGNIAKKMEKENYKVEIYTSDRDYLQLIDDNITIELIKKGLKDIKEMNEATFVEEWGFKPIQIIDYKALRGDDSDNLKGIPGIGDKTAKELIKNFGSYEEIIKNADTSKKIGQNIIEFQENGRLCLKLATIKTDDEIPLNKDDLIYKGYDFNKLNNFMQKYDFKTLINKIPSSLRKKSEENEKVSFKNVTSSIEFLEEINDYMGIAIDISNENYHYATLLGVSIYVNNKNLYISKENLLKDDKLLGKIKDSNIKKYAFDFKKIYVVFKNNGIEINGLFFDLLLASYLIEPSMSNELQNVLSYFGIDISYALNNESLFNDESLLSCISANYSYKLEEKVINILKENKQLDLLYEIEQPLTIVLANMEIEGFPLNKDKLLEFRDNFQTKIDELRKAIVTLSGVEFNLNSPKQLGEILYDKLNLTPSSKSRSTSAENLLKMIDKHPIIPLILEYRKYSKILSTYVDGLMPFIDENGLIHATFNQALTTTGRLSSSEPNLQNISVRDEEGKMIRKAFFYNDPKLNILSLDYSQIELRILAHLSNSKTMINVFNSDEDIHSETAKKIFHLDREPTSLERRHAKAVNFGIVYGISDWGLADQLKISVTEAKEIIASFYKEFPEIKAFLNSLIAQAEIKGYTTTMFNRHRYLKNINSQNYTEREFEKRAAMNAPIQGSAADLIKIAMIQVYNALKEGNYKAKIVSQIHDEIILKVDDDEKDEVLNLVKSIMENCVQLNVKLKVDGGSAKTWYDAK